MGIERTLLGIKDALDIVKIKITRRTLLSLLSIALFIIMIRIMQSAAGNSTGALTVASWVLVLVLPLSLASWRFAGHKFMSLYVILYTLMYLFSAGFFVLLAFRMPIDEITILEGYSDETLINAVYFLTYSFSAFHAGAIIIGAGRIEMLRRPPIKERQTDHAGLLVAIILLGIGIPFDLYVTITSVIANTVYGYASLEAMTASSVVTSFDGSVAAFMYPGIFLYCLSVKKMNWKKSPIVWYVIIRTVLLMYAGKRGQAFMVFLPTCWLLFTWFNKKSIRIWLLLLVGYLMLVAFAVSVDLRYSVDKSILDFLYESFVLMLTPWVVIKSVLLEAGSSLRPLLLAMDTASGISPRMGMTYVFSAILIIPSFLRGNLWTVGQNNYWIEFEYSVFGNLLGITNTGDTSYGVGSSLFAEAYFNYGLFGWIPMLILGGFITCILMPKRRANDVMNRRMLALALGASVFIFVMIRASSTLLLKTCVHYILLPRIMLYFADKYKPYPKTLYSLHD